MPVLATLLFIGTSGMVKAQQAAPSGYPKVTGYVGLLHPIVTFGSDKPHYNFDGGYTAGLPTGINLWKSQQIGFSMEFVPTIRSTGGTSKMSNFCFHPGVLFGLGKGWTVAARAAFETSGRYGFTPVLNKVVIKGKQASMFAAVPVPARFGNDQPATLTIGFQFGVAF
ncbi:hypothetical protein ACQKLP_14605 [Chitinophaga sp. NPDC101104]|uniref:hypothetical protein n=1 Tax=Chitinophaga sp. NPDC101104 TaxID=3390561 RepID=UPI003CFFC21E